MNYKELEDIIVAAYTSGTSPEEAEKNAARFLHAQLEVSLALKDNDLDARMRKTGVKALKSAVRTNEISKHDKKPTEGALDDVVNLDTVVQGEQDALDKVETKRDQLQRYYDVFLNAHIFFRGVAKGNFGG